MNIGNENIADKVEYQPSSTFDVLKDQLGSAFDSKGLKLVHIESSGDSRNTIIRIYIDKPGGVGLDDCQMASKISDPIIEDLNLIKGSFSVEVSSLGVDRPLFNLDDIRQQIGNEVNILLLNPVEERRKWVGKVITVFEESIVLGTEVGDLNIDYVNIKKANLVAKLDF